MRNSESFNRCLKQTKQYPSAVKPLYKLANGNQIKFIILDLLISEDMFYRAPIQTLNVWSIKIQDSPTFRKRSKLKQRRMLNTFHAFIYYCHSVEHVEKPFKLVISGKGKKQKVDIKNPTFTKKETASESVVTPVVKLKTTKTKTTTTLPIENAVKLVAAFFIKINLFQHNAFLSNYHCTACPFIPPIDIRNMNLRAA